MAHRQEQTSGGAGFISPGNVPSSFYVDSLKAIVTLQEKQSKLLSVLEMAFLVGRTAGSNPVVMQRKRYFSKLFSKARFTKQV